MPESNFSAQFLAKEGFEGLLSGISTTESSPGGKRNSREDSCIYSKTNKRKLESCYGCKNILSLKV